MGVSKSKDAKMIEQSINAQFQQPGQQQQQQQMFQPNGAQGFVQSPVQGFVQSPTQGFVQPPGAFPTQQQLNAQLGQQLQQMQQQQPQMQIQQQIPSIGQAPQAFPQQQTFPSFPAFPAMPQNVTMGNMQFPNLPSLPANAIFPSNTSAAFPVTFNQQMKPLIPGYAPAPDRRQLMPQQQMIVHEHEQGEFVGNGRVGAFYVEQQVQMPPQMQVMTKTRKVQQQPQQH